MKLSIIEERRPVLNAVGLGTGRGGIVCSGVCVTAKRVIEVTHDVEEPSG